MKRLVVIAIALSLAACSGTTTTEPSVQGGRSGDASVAPTDVGARPYYEGATVEVVLPTGPGGGADALLQAVLPYLTKHVPGNPEFVVNYLEGAGGVRGGNEFALRGEAGMSAMFTTFSSRMAWALNDPAVEYDLAELPIMLAMPISNVLVAREDSGVASVEDLAEVPGDQLFFGGQAPTGIGAVHLLAFEVLGLREDLNIIWGYGGTAERQLLLESGELNLDLTSDSLWLQSQDHLAECCGITPIFAYGYFDENGELVNTAIEGADGELVPTLAGAYETLHGQQPSGEAWDAYRALLGVANAGSTLVLHADAPQEAVDAMREGAIAALADPEFLAQATVAESPEAPKAGDDLASVETAMLDVDPAIREWALNWLLENYPEQMAED